MRSVLRSTIQRRARAYEEYKGILARADESGEFTAEDREQLDRLDEAINKDTADIERLQRAVDLEARFNQLEPAPPADVTHGSDGPSDTQERDEKYRHAWVDFVRYGTGALDNEARQVLATGRATLGAAEARALGIATDAAGGYLVPPGFEARLVEVMKMYGPMLDEAELSETSSGNSIEWPTLDDTANKGAILAENTQATEQDVALGTETVDAYMYTSKLVRVSLQLIQDSAIDVEDLLERKLAERIGRIVNEHFTTGTDTAQPEGIVTGGTVGVTLPVGNTTTITADGLIDLVHSVDPAYRNAPGAGFMMNDASIKAIRKLKDTTEQYIWQPGLSTGQPDSLLGYPVRVNPDMAVPAASAKTVIFGSIRAAYLARRVLGIQQLRLGERYADFLQVGFLAFARFDGVVQNANAYRVLQQSAT